MCKRKNMIVYYEHEYKWYFQIRQNSRITFEELKNQHGSAATLNRNLELRCTKNCLFKMKSEFFIFFIGCQHSHTHYIFVVDDSIEGVLVVYTPLNTLTCRKNTIKMSNEFVQIFLTCEIQTINRIQNLTCEI